jgi:hypothetical protein
MEITVVPLLVILVGTALGLVGVFMWQGGWATLAAAGLILVLGGMCISLEGAITGSEAPTGSEAVTLSAQGRLCQENARISSDAASLRLSESGIRGEAAVDIALR